MCQIVWQYRIAKNVYFEKTEEHKVLQYICSSLRLLGVAAAIITCVGAHQGVQSVSALQTALTGLTARARAHKLVNERKLRLPELLEAGAGQPARGEECKLEFAQIEQTLSEFKQKYKVCFVVNDEQE